MACEQTIQVLWASRDADVMIWAWRDTDIFESQSVMRITTNPKPCIAAQRCKSHVYTMWRSKDRAVCLLPSNLKL